MSTGLVGLPNQRLTMSNKRPLTSRNAVLGISYGFRALDDASSSGIPYLAPGPQAGAISFDPQMVRLAHLAVDHTHY
jgi:hypothetical protein